ncbi:MAG: hypothetical protein KDC18_00715 [Alphaproteobacteria bacterium]|nr:hypothetical protein [Alphaproteobacteria bacterium]MCB9929846.1 hypothetical protein [Alphaproteobacteria bacterium]
MAADDRDRSLDEARDILFGAQQRAQESRLAQIEANLTWKAANAAALIEDLDRRVTERLDRTVEPLLARIADLEARLAALEAQNKAALEAQNKDDAGND